MLKLTYLSHSGFALDDGKYKVLIDPFLTGNPNAPVHVDNISADFIILTHAHGDHIGDGFSIAKKHDATIIAVNELANYATENGAKAHNMHIGGGWDFPFGRVKFTIAHHGSSTDDGRYMGEPAGVVLKIGGRTLYHTGDTGLFLDMKLIGELDKIDIMFAPIGDNFTMGIDDAVKAVEFACPELVIPIHYNTFPVIQADPAEFKSKVEANNKVECKIMEYGAVLEF